MCAIIRSALFNEAVNMDGNGGLVTCKVVMNPARLQDTYVGLDGTVWGYKDSKRFRLGIFPEQLYALIQEGTLETTIENALRETARKVLQVWLEKTALPSITEFSQSLGSVLDQCFAEATRVFRKEFISKLGLVGAEIWHKILQEQFEEISRIYLAELEQGEKKKGVSIDSPLLPPYTRFWWRRDCKGTVWDLFCFEFPPEKRTITISDRFRKLPFPWLCILVAFKNGGFYRLGSSRAAFWVFYRPGQLTSEEATIYFPHLPHTWSDWPYGWCLGSSIPVIKLADPNWSATLLDHFWQTAFKSRDAWPLAREAKTKIPEIASLDKWEMLTPEKMTELPWFKVDLSLKEFVCKVLTKLTQTESSEEKLLQERQQAEKELVQRFRERLEEELAFLGGRIVIPSNAEQQLKALLGENTASLHQTLFGGFEKSCRRAARQASFQHQITMEVEVGERP